ncbi:uncharacterized protein LOC110452961 isoform X1 [Mizuhopecten yessoensis]|uniref:uncharacterized protein LOC110452961 isoform X1 n=2 Tax=Mizuhopecten yessoensis TaxID=6573 RepID=UPI000B45DD0A|nr:uncharacterized protein LOC110452961 isoform X1 [Mizuhopecten yessoensis]
MIPSTVSMKFYVHSKEHGFTMVVRCEEDYNGTVEDITKMFVKELKKKLPTVCPDNDVEVRKSKKIVDLKEEVKKRVKDKDDLFLTLHQGVKPKSDAKKPANVKEPELVEPKVTKEDHAPAPPTQERKTNSKTDGLMQLAVQFITKGNFQQAAITLEEITKTDPRNTEAHLGLVDIFLKADRPKRALKWCRKTKEFCSSNELALRYM